MQIGFSLSPTNSLLMRQLLGGVAPDVTAPTLTSPTGTQTGSTTGTSTVSTNEANGTLYSFLSTSSTPPSAANLKTGTGAVTSASQAVTATGVQTVNWTGLTASTLYYTHWLHSDAAGNDSVIVSGAGFTTAAGTATIGGTAIGAAGTSYTSGFVLSGGDDFDGALDLVQPASRYGRYATTRGGYIIPGTGQQLRGSGGLGGWDVDPYYTGNGDSNRGSAVSSFSDMIVQSGGMLRLNQRTSTTPERAHFASALNCASSMIHTALSFLGRAPIVFEWLEKRTPQTQSHMTGWLMQANAVRTDNDLELDWEAASTADGVGDGTAVNVTSTAWTAGSVVTTAGTATPLTPSTATTHKYAIKVLANGNVEWWLDDVLAYSLTTQQAKALQAPYFAMFTNHAYAGRWSSAYPDAPYDIYWFRVWRPSTGKHWAPLSSNAFYQSPFNTAFSFVLPDKLTTWGDANVTETVEAVMMESNEPGGTTNGVTYAGFPTGIAYDPATRTLSGTVSDKAGRLHIIRYVNQSGDTCTPQRIALEIGPKVTAPAAQSHLQGEYVSLDLYNTGDVGVLTPKTISVSGLPAGLSFDPATALVTGFPTTAGSSTVTVTVTNSVGQAASYTYSHTVNSLSYSGWTGEGWFDANDGLVLGTGSQVATLTNKRTSGVALTGFGTATNRTRVAATQNGRPVLRIIRDVTSSATIVRFAAAATDPLSTLFQGNDKPYIILIAYKPTDTNTGFIVGASATVNATDTQNISLVRRSATATSVRRQLVTATSNDVSWGTGQASNVARVVAIKHTGTAVTVWDNSATTKSVTATAQDVAAFNTSLEFNLFAATTQSASGMTYAGTCCSLDFYEAIIQSTSQTDAEVQQAITDMAAKWGITLT